MPASSVTRSWMLPSTGLLVNGAVGGRMSIGMPEVGVSIVEITLPVMRAPGTTVRSLFSGDSQDAGPAVEGAGEVVSPADAGLSPVFAE